MKPAWQKHLQCLFHGASSETDSWLDFAKDCGYISSDQHQGLVTKCKSVGSMLGSMMKNPDPFILK